MKHMVRNRERGPVGRKQITDEVRQSGYEFGLEDGDYRLFLQPHDVLLLLLLPGPSHLCPFLSAVGQLSPLTGVLMLCFDDKQEKLDSKWQERRQ